MATMETDTDVLEWMRDRTLSLLSTLEEGLGAVRQLSSQMSCEDSFVTQFGEWSAFSGEVGTIRSSLADLTEALESLLTVIEAAPIEYLEKEQLHINAIDRLTARLSVLQTGLGSCMESSYPVGLMESEGSSAARALEKELDLSVQEMEIANLMAVSKVLQTEYAHGYVTPTNLTDTDAESEKEKAKQKEAENTAKGGSAQ